MKTAIKLALLLAGIIMAGCQTPDSQGSHGSDSDLYSVDSVKDDTSFRVWFSFYYLTQDHQLTPEAITFMSKHGYMKEHPEISSTFLAYVFERNEDRIDGWLSKVSDVPPEDWDVILAALWFSNSEVAREAMKKYISRSEDSHRKDFEKMALKRNEVNLLKLEVDNPQQVNLMWAAFSATGNTDYIKKVISLVHLYETEATTMEAVIGEAAIMTLANNALQHEVVAQQCIEANNNHPNSKTRILLNAMLTAVAQIGAEQSDTTLSH